MPIRPPRLDDRAYADLVAELVARIPAHTPEWTDPRPGDPGRTLIELFAWLGDALLYRMNHIPERQRLEFLRMVGISPRAAHAARGIVALGWRDLDRPHADLRPVPLAPLAVVDGPPSFETLRPVTLFPVEIQAFVKRKLRPDEATAVAPLLQDLGALYRLSAGATPYVTAPAFPAPPSGLDLPATTVDSTLWFAVLAGRPEDVVAAREALGPDADGRPRVLSIGVVPALEALDPTTLEVATGVSATRPRPVTWEIVSSRSGAPKYLELERAHDDTEGLVRTGTVELVLPAERYIGDGGNDVRTELDAGVGARPPRLDDARLQDRLVTWIRMRPTRKVDHLALAWAGGPAVQIDQRRTFANAIVGAGDGRPDHQIQLPFGSIERVGFALQVEEEGRGWVDWALTETLGLLGPDDRAYALDDEAGILRFGDGLRGKIPGAGRRIRVLAMRAGGGAEGNLPAATLKTITARNILDGAPVTRPIGVTQPVPTTGGAAAETVAEAEQRIPQVLRHRDRAITADDMQALAAETPGVALGRVEVLPGFRPAHRQQGIPGVVSVSVLPRAAIIHPPNPRPGRHTLEAVHAWLSPRVTLGTELYVIGVEYVPLALSVAVEVRAGFGPDETVEAVKAALRQLLWPIAPGGPLETGAGWPLGRPVREREIDVAIARVPGVDEVRSVKLFTQDSHGRWVRTRAVVDGSVQVALRPWQLPELLRVAVVATGDAADDVDGNDGATGREVAVPVVPEVC